ncbi:porin [Roseateles sp. BYS180W]|uniref:Porin n=1 Tax=Roseateles rivi TaxID=3299028 RepID=A0ABW7FWG7_9BURK
MKLKHAYAVLALGAMAGMVHAQDADKASVTLWGVADVNYGVTTNVAGKGTQVAAGQGGMYGSRLGVNGKSAKMANGLRAIFSAEGAVNPPYPSAFNFNRYAFVGLEGDFGRLRLGTTMRPYDDTAWNYEALDSMAFSLGPVSSWRAFGANTKAIRYNTNDLGNKTVLDMFLSAGGVAGKSSAGTRYGAQVTTTLGVTDVLAYYERSNDADGKQTQTTQGWNDSTGNVLALMTRTNIDNVKLYAGVHRYGAPDAAPTDPTRTQIWHVGASVQATTDLNLKLGYYALSHAGHGVTKAGAKTFAAAAQYNLGFAWVYAVAGHLANEANGTVDITGANGAQPKGSSQNGLKVGLTYVF